MVAEQQGAPAAAETTGAAPGAEATAADVAVAPDTTLDVGQHQGTEVSADDTAAAVDLSPEDAAAAADEADLEQYPEAVRDDFRALPSEKRKALYEEAERRAEARITANRERTDRLEADQKAQAAAQAAAEARTAEIRKQYGKYIGAEAQTLELPNGNTIELPALADMEELSKTQRGRNELAEKYGLDDASAEFWGFIFKRSSDAMGAMAQQFDNGAWNKLDASLRAGVEAELGVEAQPFLEKAGSPHGIIKGVADHFRGQIAQLKKEHEARAEALNANAEGMRGRVLAATSRSLPSGGRSAGGATSSAAELRRLRTENPADFAERAMRGEFAGIDLTK